MVDLPAGFDEVSETKCLRVLLCPKHLFFYTHLYIYRGPWGGVTHQRVLKILKTWPSVARLVVFSIKLTLVFTTKLLQHKMLQILSHNCCIACTVFIV